MTAASAPKQVWFALWILFAINLLNFFDRAMPAAVFEPIRKQWGLSDTRAAWLTTAFTLVYAAAGVPLGRLADRRNRKVLLAVGVAAWSLFTAASGLAWGFWSLFLARLGVGIGEAVCAPAGNSMIGDLFGPEKRARAISIFMLGLPAGLFLSYLVTGALAEAHGWRVPFYLAGLAGLVLVPIILLVREPARGEKEIQSDAEVRATRSVYLQVLRRPGMGWIIASGVFYNFNTYALNAFLAAFLMRGHGLSLKEAGRLSAVVLGAVTAAGLIFGGWAADRAHRWRPDGRLLLAGVGLVVMSVCTLLALRQPMGATASFMVLMCGAMFFAYFYYGPVYATIQDLIEPRLRGTAMALYFCAMYVLGASFGPVGTGALSDYFSRQAMQNAGAAQMTETFKALGLHHAMYVIPLLAMFCAITLFAGARTLRRPGEAAGNPQEPANS